MVSIWTRLAVALSIVRAASAQVGWSTTTATEWSDWSTTCPPAQTVLVSVTQYVPLTDVDTYTTSLWATATENITIYQTVISTTTEYSTITNSTTDYSTATAYVTETATTTTPVTLTATEIISEEILTCVSTSVILCPTRTANPTYTANEPYPTDWTWGCPPGWLCKPVQEECNFEVGLPDRNYYCSPNECIPADVIPAVLPTWDTTIYGNSTPLTDPSLTIQRIDDYFNMAPPDFGLSYEIFVPISKPCTTTTTIYEGPATPTVAARQAQTSVPGACYPWCNNCLLEAQSVGKTPALCQPGSAYEVSLNQCEQCITVHSTDTTTDDFVPIAPQFQQFLDYCAKYTTVTATTSATIVSVSSTSSATIVVPTTSLTAILTTSTSSSSSPPPASPTSSTSTATTSPIPTTASTTSYTTAYISPTTHVTIGNYTTTVTILSTAPLQTTIAGTALASLTLIYPVIYNGNSTRIETTSYPSGATVILPMGTSSTTDTYVDTVTLNSVKETLVSAKSTIVTPVTAAGDFVSSESSSSAAGAGAASSTTPATYTGGSSRNTHSQPICVAAAALVGGVMVAAWL